MDKDNIRSLGAFSVLFNKNVPHILENIFFSLNYDSFLTCGKVCKTWHELLKTKSYQIIAREKWKRRKGEEKRNDEEMLISFIMRRNLIEARSLILKGVNPNYQRANGYKGTPLHYAIKYNCPAEQKNMAKLLLESGADPNMADVNGNTPLFSAALYRRFHVVSLLLDVGANPNKANSQDETPLFAAVRHENMNMMKLLLKRGADPNLLDKWGRSPMVLAVKCKYRKRELVQILLDAGADPKVTDGTDGNG